MNANLKLPIVELKLTAISDQHLFIDEIEIWGTDFFYSEGEVTFNYIKLAVETRGQPRLLNGEIPPGTRAELWFRSGSSGGWEKEGWDSTITKNRIQFRIVLYSSSDLKKTPTIRDISFEPFWPTEKIH